MSKESINLCGQSGTDVVGLLLEKITDPALAITVGSMVIEQILHIDHHGDGLPIVAARTPDSTVTFQYDPTETIFADSAVDADGQSICN